MQLRNMLTQFAICSLVTLFCITVVQARENPNKPRTADNSSAFASEFVCGVYKGSDKELLWHHYQYQARMKSLTKSDGRLGTQDFDFEDVAVIEDDGSVLISGVNLFDTDMQTFHFTPNAGNGYDISNVTFAFDFALGSDLTLGDDANATVTIPFTFDYYGTSWTDIHVNANGIASFGADVNPSGFFNDADFLNTIPKIAAYFLDLNPQAANAPSTTGVFAKAETDKLTITWNQLPEFGTSNLNTVQLVLHSDNTFDVSFNGIATKNQTNNSSITFGIHPGGMPNLEIISFSDDIPFAGPAGAGMFENYLNIMNPKVNDVALMNKFYQTYPDSFFQAVYLTNFQQTMFGFANERTVKSNLQGVGEVSRDNSHLYGSNGVLESLCNMNQMSAWLSNPETRFSSSQNFLTVLGQESGHRWGTHVNFIDANGDTSDLIIGRAAGHWSYYFDSDHSVMQGGNWEHVSGNTFTTPTQIDFFGDIDEYIMGLRTPEEVSPSFFVSSPTNDMLAGRSQRTPLINASTTGTAVDVTIEDIIAAEGPRLPAEADSPKDLRQAFLLVVQNGTTPSQSDLDKIANFRGVWEDYFERSVDGRMTLNTSLTRTFPVAVISGHVLDENTNQPIENITVKSSERGFDQMVPGGGRYTFRYLAGANSGTAESITIITDAPGYVADTLVTTIAYGTETEVNIELQPITTSVEETENQAPTSFGLEQNYPNPFNPATTIQIKLPIQSAVTLDIYNLNGQLIRTLVQGNLPAGNHSFVWDGRNERGSEVASGLYVSRLKAGPFTRHRKMLLMK